MTPHKLRMSTERRNPRWWPANKASDIVCLHLQKHLMTELNQKLTKYMPQMFLRCSSKWKLLCKEFGGEEGVYLRECLPLIYFPPYSINFALGSYICFCGCPSVRACCLHMQAKLIESHFMNMWTPHILICYLSPRHGWIYGWAYFNIEDASTLILL